MSVLRRAWGRADKPSVFWGSVLVGFGLFDWWAHRHVPRWTLSWTGRRWYRMEEHAVGEYALLGTWGGLTLWFLPHMINPARLKRATHAAAAVLASATAEK